MLAPSQLESHSHDALPVCLAPRQENPHRLVSLWGLVKSLNLGLLAGSIQQIERIWIDAGVAAKLEPASVDAELIDRAEGIIEAIKQHSDECGFKGCAQDCDLSLIIFQRDDLNVTGIESELNHIRNSLLKEIVSRHFVPISEDFTYYAENDCLFGNEVKIAFPSAAADLKEAGNCLAVECGTACVFHAMRAAEVALRVLAADRQVQYPDASVSSKQVSDLLAALDGKLMDLRKADAKNWPSRDIKDAQIKFYHTAVAEMRDFNEAWRKSMAHAHEGAFYDPPIAENILRHVRQFMQVLAPRLSELKSTPLYWAAL